MAAANPAGSGKGDETYDPLGDLFVAQFASPPNLMAVNLRALSPFQRALLVIDGTVTKFLEAFTLQPVDVVLVSQEVRRLAEPHDWLETESGEAVIAREVMLRGRHDYLLYAYAVSLLVVDRLPESVRRGLTSNPGGLGRILLDSKLETRREVLWYGRERVSRTSVAELEGRELLSRTYRIIAGGSPLMLINERFPIPDDLLPSHE